MVFKTRDQGFLGQGPQAHCVPCLVQGLVWACWEVAGERLRWGVRDRGNERVSEWMSDRPSVMTPFTDDGWSN